MQGDLRFGCSFRFRRGFARDIGSVKDQGKHVLAPDRVVLLDRISPVRHLGVSHWNHLTCLNVLLGLYVDSLPFWLRLGHDTLWYPGLVAVPLFLDKAIPEGDCLRLIGATAYHSELNACFWLPRRSPDGPNEVLVSLGKPLTTCHRGGWRNDLGSRVLGAV